MVQQPSSRGSHGSHFKIPMQFVLGLLFTTTGALLLLKKFGSNFVPFIPEDVFIYVNAAGALIGGLYLIIHHIYTPRIYLR